MESFLTAILNDDRPQVRKLVASDPGLAIQSVDKPRLYQSKIFHWLYAGDTALHLAAAGYRVEIVKLLLAAGADPNVAGRHRLGRPLHYAADGYVIGPAWNEKLQVRTIRVLLAVGADVNAADKNGATPLHRAVRTRCAAAVECLLDAGADPTRKNKPGSTPFHLAVQNTGHGGSGAEAAKSAQADIIRLFVDRGVKSQLKDGKGKTVIQWAKSDWIRELLR
ncbi:MAG TPA: ankyrin repeat domain-containing protein [Fimbriiglobus sp.]|jgi:hypothetical protein